jgi:hypothetical protein
MWWILIVALYGAMAYNGYRRARRMNSWNWLLFFVAIAFCLLASCLLWLPLVLIDRQSRWFVPGEVGGVVLAVVGLVWFVIECRRWEESARRRRGQSDAGREG